MPTFALFRLSTYLAVAISFIALAYAEWIFVPEATIILALMVAALGLLYRFEHRVSLSLRQANLVGGILGLVFGGWLVWHLLHPGTGLLENLPWSVRIMPYIGPVLAVLIPAKILRPHKHVGDYWSFHAAALCLVALATALAEDGLFFSLVMLYLVCAVWSLVLFFLLRSSGKIAPIPTGVHEAIPQTHETGEVAKPRRREWKIALGSLAVSLVIALPFFLLTPRTGGPVFDLAGRRFEVGFSADQLLDLNRTGTLHLNTEAAFEVEVKDPASDAPVLSLPMEMRWRSLNGTYTQYMKGLWRRDDLDGRGRGRAPESASPPGVWQPPTFGPGTVRVNYSVPTHLRTMFLAEPMEWKREASAPVAWLLPEGPVPWAMRSDGVVVSMTVSRLQRFRSTYVQYLRPDAKLTTSPPFIPAWKSLTFRSLFEPESVQQNREELRRHLRENPLPAIKDYSDQLLQRLVASKILPQNVRLDIDRTTGLPHERQHAAIAQAFRDHLRSSGQFVYSFRLRRQDPRLDPAEDFLRNTREGHCERFATALALMLRSQGIPAQFVLGFKGQESMEDGKYVIRQDNAHAWVEALIPVPGDATGQYYQWLSLDPTPGQDESEAMAAGSWWEQTLQRGREILANYVVGYDAVSREKVIENLKQEATSGNLLRLVLVILIGVLLARYWRRARRKTRLRTQRSWDQEYASLLDVLRPLELRPEPGQTPREFALAARTRLLELPHASTLADIPLAWTESHYAASFGGRPLTASRIQELDQTLASLRRALKSGG